MAGNAIFGSDADAPSASSRPNTASRAPWGLSGDEPDAPPRSARGAPRAVEAAPWAHDEPEHKSASHRGRGRCVALRARVMGGARRWLLGGTHCGHEPWVVCRANAPSNVNTDHISYGNGNTGRMDADQRRITGKVGSGGDAAADMAAFVYVEQALRGAAWVHVSGVGSRPCWCVVWCSDARNEAVKHKQRQRGGGLW